MTTLFNPGLMDIIINLKLISAFRVSLEFVDCFTLYMFGSLYYEENGCNGQTIIIIRCLVGLHAAQKAKYSQTNHKNVTAKSSIKFVLNYFILGINKFLF